MQNAMRKPATFFHTKIPIEILENRYENHFQHFFYHTNPNELKIKLVCNIVVFGMYKK